MTDLKAPFPYFGGKRSCADLIWSRFGDVTNFVEPFAGSLAVLLARPLPFAGVETVNDADSYVANFWRATSCDPESVVEHVDWPVNEADLHARHRWLVLSDDAAIFREKMRTDPEHYDAKIAGWWCWGICCWIGSGWCQMPESADWDQRPVLTNKGQGQGVNGGLSKQLPDLTSGRTSRGGRGILAAGRPQLADAYDVGRGVHASASSADWDQRPQIHGADSGVTVNGGGATCAARRAWLLDWFGRLRDRLRLVRVCCGDWSRVCSSESVLTRLGTTAVFLDPPYSKESGRAESLYATESLTVAHDVRAWCVTHGPNPQIRICLAGYVGEGHEELEQHGWECVPWKSGGGYGNRTTKGKGNTKKERLWFSPACVRGPRGLFDEVAS